MRMRTLLAPALIGIMATGLLATAFPAAASTLSIETAAPGLSDEAPSTDPVIAHYHGEEINLALGWVEAQVCAVFDTEATDVRCYENDAKFREDTGLPEGREASAMAITDCPTGWNCIWQNTGFTGRRLSFSEEGNYPLSNYGFRDQASSAVSRFAGWSCGMQLVDYRTALPDPSLFIFRGNSSSNLSDWNNRADEVRLC
jgi:hypothetical protein